MRFVFVHGWGFDAGFWRPLQDALGVEGLCLDHGYHGPASLDIAALDEPFVAVGHSFGVQWLLHRCATRPMKALIAINGFARFVRGEGFESGVHPRILTRMIAGFERGPETVYRDFLKLCGDAEPHTDALNHGRLLEGLKALNEWDERARLAGLTIPVLALAGQADNVVPQAMSEAAFERDILKFKEEGDHLLPLSAPEWCAAQIKTFLEDNGL